ncbi:MAG: Aerobic respiration control sensor protein ArcB, partial [Reyranella sp.]|nr:Aerobic respiration control sensor protein ArcB [Reyranella sp.]
MPDVTTDVLQENDERYRTLFDLYPTAVYSCDASGVIQKFNRQAAELWGREPAIGDADGRFCGSFKLFRPDGSFMPHEQCPMADVLSAKISEVRDAEVLIERPDGSRVAVVVNIRPVKNKLGEVTAAISCFYDITARKQAEEALLKEGALQSAIFNSANFSSIATDAKGVIQIFNVGAERMLGYAAAEVMNQITPADISDPQEVVARAEALSIELGTPITPGFEALVFKASRGIEDIYELTYIRKDGSRFPAVV